MKESIVRSSGKSLEIVSTWHSYLLVQWIFFNRFLSEQSTKMCRSYPQSKQRGFLHSYWAISNSLIFSYYFFRVQYLAVICLGCCLFDKCKHFLYISRTAFTLQEVRVNATFEDSYSPFPNTFGLYYQAVRSMKKKIQLRACITPRMQKGTSHICESN